MFTGGKDAGRVSPEQASRSAACCSASSGGGWQAGFWPAQGPEKAGGLETEYFRNMPGHEGGDNWTARRGTGAREQQSASYKRDLKMK